MKKYLLLIFMFMLAGGMNIVGMELSNLSGPTEKISVERVISELSKINFTEEELLKKHGLLQCIFPCDQAEKIMLAIEPNFYDILYGYQKSLHSTEEELLKEFLWLRSYCDYGNAIRIMRYTEPDFSEILHRHTMKQPKSCELCLEDKTVGDFKRLSCCKYNASCTDCLLELINTSLEEKTVAYINCPNRKCAKKIEEKDIRVITHNHSEVYKAFCDIVTDELLNKDSNIKQCPTPNCSFRFENNSVLKQAFTCPQCNQRYCSHCLVRHAPEMTCEEAREHAQLVGDKSNIDKANEEWLQSNTKACPNCKIVVQKNGGCNHMTCKKCRYEFCWTCGAAYRTTRCNTDYCATTNAQVPLGQPAQGQVNNNNGMTPLWLAAQNGHAEIVNLLIEHQVNPNLNNRGPVPDDAEII